MNPLREDFVEKIKKGYVEERRKKDYDVYKNDKSFDITEETIAKEEEKYSGLLKSGIAEIGDR